MNNTWSVRTMPCLVVTVLPSTSGKRSRCTPSRDTSGPPCSPRLTILSISSRNTMPFCSTLYSARVLRSSSLTSLPASSSAISLSASFTRRRRRLVRAPAIFWNRPCNWLVISSMPGGAMISTPTGAMLTSISISLSSSSPWRNFLRNTWRVTFSSAASVLLNPLRGRGSNASRTRSYFGLLLLSFHLNRDVDQIKHKRNHVAADVADLGEFGRLDLDERRIGELGKTPRDFGLAAAGRADHQNIFRGDLVAQLLVDLRAAPAVTQRNGDGALGLGLADDVLVEFLHDLAGGHVGHTAYSVLASNVRVMKNRRRRGSAGCVEFFDGEVMIGIDTDIGRNGQRALDDGAGVEFGVLHQRARRRLRVRAAGSDRGEIVLGLDDVAVAGNQLRCLLVRHHQHGLQAPQHAVGAPVFGEFDRGAHQIARMFFELALETLEQCEGIGRAAGETGNDALAVQAPHFAGITFHHGLAQRNL